MLNRRQFGSAVLLGSLAASPLLAADEKAARPVTRGVVLYPWDLALNDWPERAAAARLTTIGLHAARRLDVLVDFIRSEKGIDFLARCQKLGIQVEYELHAMGELLSRELYYKDTSLFRVDQNGQRNGDSNCCPSSPQALSIIAEKAFQTARILRPTTGRYFFWPDDGREWCHCEKCKGFSASDQAVVVENAIVAALRRHVDPKATVCHIAYHLTLNPPKEVRPQEGLFVEFAPIQRSYERSIGDRLAKLSHGGPDPVTHGEYLDLLGANLECFGKPTAQVLEYWLDVSRFSGWQRPSKKLPWNPDVVRRDVKAYVDLGVRHLTSFATWIDDRYLVAHGEPPLIEYGRILNGE